MELITFESDAFYKMEARLIKMAIELAKGAQEKHIEGQEWISLYEAKRMLGVKSTAKIAQLRNNNSITYSKFGHRSVRYSRSSILEYLNRNIK